MKRCTRSVLGLALLLVCVSFLKAQNAPKPDTSPHTVQMISVERDIELEVLDWGGTGRPLGISPCKIRRQPIEIPYGEVVLSSVVPPHALPVFCPVSGALFPASMQAQLAWACMTSWQLIRSLYAFSSGDF